MATKNHDYVATYEDPSAHYDSRSLRLIVVTEACHLSNQGTLLSYAANQQLFLGDVVFLKNS